MMNVFDVFIMEIFIAVDECILDPECVKKMTICLGSLMKCGFLEDFKGFRKICDLAMTRDTMDKE